MMRLLFSGNKEHGGFVPPIIYRVCQAHGGFVPPIIYRVCQAHGGSVPPIIYRVCQAHGGSVPPIIYHVCQAHGGFVQPQQSDLQVGTSGLLRDATLETAVIISIFSDARAANDDLLPDGSFGNDYRADRKGWLGDAISTIEGDVLGSKLWLLSREKQTEETRPVCLAHTVYVGGTEPPC